MTDHPSVTTKAVVCTTTERTAIDWETRTKQWSIEDLREIFPEGDGSIVDGLLTYIERMKQPDEPAPLCATCDHLEALHEPFNLQHKFVAKADPSLRGHKSWKDLALFEREFSDRMRRELAEAKACTADEPAEFDALENFAQWCLGASPEAEGMVEHIITNARGALEQAAEIKQRLGLTKNPVQPEPVKPPEPTVTSEWRGQDLWWCINGDWIETDALKAWYVNTHHEYVGRVILNKHVVAYANRLPANGGANHG